MESDHRGVTRESDLADRIASKLQGNGGNSGSRHQRGNVHDRLMVWVNGRVLCDPETETVLWDISSLRRWYMMEGLGAMGWDKAADLWSDILHNKEKVDLGLWHIRDKKWYYDMDTGELVVVQ